MSQTTLTSHRAAPSPPISLTDVMAAPHVTRLLAGTLLGRLPNGMAPAALVLFVTGSGGGVTFGGLLSALYILASALSQPVKGFLLDRHGQTRVSGPAALINSASLLILTTVSARSQPVLATALVALAGACTPPLEAGLRALWSKVLPDPGQRRVALAADTGSQGLLFVVGPVLAAFLASQHGPGTALAATAATGITGSLIVLTSAPSRHWRSPARHPGARSTLHNATLLRLLLALAGVGVANGAVTVWAVGMAEQHATAMLIGLIPGAYAAGSLIGGLLYGRRPWPGGTTAHLLAGTAAFTIAWLPLLTLPGPHLAVALVLLPGLFLPVLITGAFLTADRIAPAGNLTETCAWMILALGVGTASGTAVGGALVAHPLAAATLPLAGAAAALAVLATAPPRPLRGRRDRGFGADSAAPD
ncbi:MFS transporter [Streptomyces virginiae]|uniref:MFS transporter n=1 Tax=Streptomyces virginiae TaxID=1961 RepID=UPI00363C2C16